MLIPPGKNDSPKMENEGFCEALYYKNSGHGMRHVFMYGQKVFFIPCDVAPQGAQPPWRPQSLNSL